MRRSFTLFSVVVHACAIAIVLAAQVFAVGTLPQPHQPLLFEAASIMPADIALPKPAQRAASASRTETAASLNAAPLAPPSEITAETGREGEPPPSFAEAIAGVASGLPGAIEGVGIATSSPPPPPLPPAPIRLHSGMKPPVKIVDVAPAYPAIARTAHVEGVVILEAVLDAQGAVSSVRVLRSIAALDQAAVDAVRLWHFTPALLNNQPVPVVMTITVNFTLNREP
jgi:protein TonB